MKTVNLVTIGRKVAEALGADWKCKTFFDHQEVCRLIRDSDGLELSMRDAICKNRLVFRWMSNAEVYKTCRDMRQHHPDVRRYDEVWPEITCTPKKTPEALAGDIRHRLLDDAERFHLRALATVDLQARSERRLDDFVEQLRNTGVKVESRSNDDIYDGIFSASGSGWDLEITPHNRKFNGYGLDDDQIIGILHILTVKRKT